MTSLLRWQAAVLLVLIVPFAGCSIPAIVKASRDGQTELVKQLLAQGADPNAKADHPSMCCGNSLWYAAGGGHADTVKLLLDHGADPNIGMVTNVLESTPLMAAAGGGHDATVELLLQRGALINPRYPREEARLGTALIAAAQSGRTGTVKLLLERGAYIDAKDKVREKTALAWAEKNGHAETAQLLREWQKNPGVLVPALAATVVAPAAAPASPAAPPPLPAAKVRSDVDAPRYSLPENPDSFALVIGIDKYKNLPEADFAVRDATAVREHLHALGYPSRNIIFLDGPNATRTGIQSYLEEWLPRNVKPHSTVFLYYSGHGAPDPKTGDAYLVPWDADVKFLKTTAYPLHQLYASLGALKTNRVIVALDACFSGAGGRSVLAKGTRPLVVKVDQGFAPQDGMALFAAASGDEVTSTMEEQGHGMFTYFFLKGLSGAAEDGRGQVTSRGLYDYLLPRVQDEARRQNREQTPQFLSAHGLDALILR